MRTHHFRSEVIYLARNFKVRSCSLYLSTYCCGLLLMQSCSKVFILHERRVLFHFLVFSTPNVSSSLVLTYLACWFVSFPKQLVTSRKAVLTVRARPHFVQKATPTPVIDCTVNTCRAGRFHDCRASISLALPPALTCTLFPAREVACSAWMLPQEIPEGSRLQAWLAGTSFHDSVFIGQGNQNSFVPVPKV